MKAHKALTRLLTNISNLRHVEYYIASMGLIAALVFSFVIYPKISIPFHVGLDPDHYGALGYGVWKLGSLSYYPETQPTISRGPFYPLFEAFCLMISSGWWPQSVQLCQCILFSLTCFLVFWISKILWGRKIAVLFSLICAFHPFLIWYTSRIWIETLATFLFTLTIASVFYLSLKPSITRSILLSCVLAVSALCKQTFFLYIFFIPLFLCTVKYLKVGWRYVVCTVVVAVFIILPWALRNMRLTQKFIPIHGGSGVTIFWGDLLVEHYTKSPFSSADIFFDSVHTAITSVRQSIPDQMGGWERELALDSILLGKSIERYRNNPTFMIKKIFSNAIFFWILGESNLKTAVISLLQIPLFLLFVLTTIKVINQKNILTLLGGMILFIWVYYFLHLPIIAAGRYSVVLIPTMLISLGVLLPSWQEKEHEII
jgi:4-amino-4-deoxy-L-arabinose transferase-like glycosyltransferase